MIHTNETLKELFTLDFNLNGQQVNAINKAVAWYEGYRARKHRRKLFYIAGYAGTGKTTVARIIAELCATMERTMFIAPTGKAAARLRHKGCPGAKTFHQFIYNVRGENDDGEPIFVAKGALDDKPLLVVLDEAYMVGEYDAEKLLEHGIPVLALGDPKQVPPVKGRAYFSLDIAEVELTEIERNSGNIVKGSMYLRDRKRLPVREYEDVVIRDGSIPDDMVLSFTNEESVILCSYNTTRQQYNERCRRLLGFSGDIPAPGEKVVCTSNQHGYGIMNGEQGIVLRYEEIAEGAEDEDEPDMMLLIYRSLTDGKERYAKFNPVCFLGDEDAKKEAYKKAGGFDFGYALTVHKSQGSEWLRVLVIEELLRGVDYFQMMYTAVTRAIKFLAIYRYK